MSYLFLSYSRRDAGHIDAISASLSEAGLPIWVDRKGIQGGEHWRSEIVSAIQSSAGLVLFLSPNSARSENVRKEIDLAEAARVAIVPVAITPVEIPPAMQYQLAGVQIIDLWSDQEAGMASLARTLERKTGGRLGKAGSKRSLRPIPINQDDRQTPDLSRLGGRSLIDQLGLDRLFGRRKV